MSESGVAAADNGGGDFSPFTALVRAITLLLAYVSAAGICVMVAVTVVDVVMRKCGHGILGAYDIVRIAGTIAAAAALPYTTAMKGHICIEVLYILLPARAKLVADWLLNLVLMGAFGVLTWFCIDYGNQLQRKGAVTLTLQIPEFWVPYVIAVSCAGVVLVLLHSLLKPRTKVVTE